MHQNMGKNSIHPKQAQILKVAIRLTAPVTTCDFTSETNLSNNTIGYHAGELIEQGYLEKGEMLENELEDFRSAVLERFTEVAAKIDEMDNER